MSLAAERARRVRLIVLDSDGVMTDGGIYTAVDEDGRALSLRRFNVHDGVGIFMLRRAGLAVAIVSGKRSRALAARAEELGVAEAHQVDAHHKLPTVQGILDRGGFEWSETACLADDLADLPLLERVGLPAAVANAVPEVRERATWIGQSDGGHGAVREFAEALLRARDEWDELVERYLEECRELAGDNG